MAVKFHHSHFKAPTGRLGLFGSATKASFQLRTTQIQVDLWIGPLHTSLVARRTTAQHGGTARRPQERPVAKREDATPRTRGARERASVRRKTLQPALEDKTVVKWGLRESSQLVSI